MDHLVSIQGLLRKDVVHSCVGNLHKHTHASEYFLKNRRAHIPSRDGKIKLRRAHRGHKRAKLRGTLEIRLSKKTTTTLVQKYKLSVFQ